MINLENVESTLLKIDKKKKKHYKDIDIDYIGYIVIKN